MGSDAVLAGSGVDATVGEGLFIAATSACSISSVCSRNANPPEASMAGVSPADGWEDDIECWWADESGLTSAKINFSYSILFHLTTSYSSYFGGKKGISRNKTSFF